MTSREQTFTSAADTIPTSLQSPKKHPGERLANYFDNFFATIVAISTLGASITFSKILQTPVEPWTDYGISKDTVQNFIAISWLCFALDLIITSFAASALSLYRPQAITYFGTSDSADRRIVLWYATLVSAILFGLALVAFIFLALTVTAYAGPIGWAAVGFTVFFGTLGFGSIIWQSPIGSRSLGIDINRTNSWKRQPNQFPGYQSSPEKEQNGFAGAVLTGDELVVKGDAVLVRARYVDDRLSRGNTIPRESMMQQPARPLSGGVPQYTAEMRRMRAASRTTNDVRISGERQNRPLERNDTRISYDEKDYGYDEEADPEIWVPANETRRRYDNGKL